MDILHLVDRLEQMVNEARSIPLTSTRIIEEETALNLIDQMRVAVPEEIKSQAHPGREGSHHRPGTGRSQRIKELAREEAKALVARDAIVQAAEARAQTISSARSATPTA
jgi:hypothetical protein